jgi:hypothetical protein
VLVEGQDSIHRIAKHRDVHRGLRQQLMDAEPERAKEQPELCPLLGGHRLQLAEVRKMTGVRGCAPVRTLVPIARDTPASFPAAGGLCS